VVVAGKSRDSTRTPSTTNRTEASACAITFSLAVGRRVGAHTDRH
jgi:hypothetical protein